MQLKEKKTYFMIEKKNGQVKIPQKVSPPMTKSVNHRHFLPKLNHVTHRLVTGTKTKRKDRQLLGTAFIN